MSNEPLCKTCPPERNKNIEFHKYTEGAVAQRYFSFTCALFRAVSRRAVKVHQLNIAIQQIQFF